MKNKTEYVGISVLDILTGLAEEWRIVLASTVVGLLVAIGVMVGSAPTYTVGFMASVGTKYGASSPMPIESPYLASRRIELRFSGGENESIKMTLYENDFDLAKRRVLEVKVTTLSKARTMELANEIVDFLMKEHGKLYVEAKYKYSQAALNIRKILEVRQALADRYRQMLAESRKVDACARGGGGDMVCKEYTDWLGEREKKYRLEVSNLADAMTRGSVTQTAIPLVPDMRGIVEKKRGIETLFSGLLGGVFLGGVLALVAQRRRLQ